MENVPVLISTRKAALLTKTANEQAEEAISQAQKWSHDMRTGASEFVERIMRTSDEQLTQYVNEIRRARQSLRASGKVEEEPKPEPKQDAQK